MFNGLLKLIAPRLSVSSEKTKLMEDIKARSAIVVY